MTQPRKQISIWFMAGIILAVYGATITVRGVYHLFHPPNVVAAGLHLDLWWGILLLAAGAIFVWRQYPGSSEDIKQ